MIRTKNKNQKKTLRKGPPEKNHEKKASFKYPEGHLRWMAFIDKGGFLRLKKIDAELSAISGKTNFLAINPKNIESERKMVEEDENYNPQFEYRPYEHDLDSMEDYLESISQQDSYMGRILEEKRKEYIQFCRLFKARGYSGFTKHSINIYGLPKEELCEKAKPTLECKEIDIKKNITTENALDLLRAELFHYGFGYSVEAKQMSSSAAVLVSQRKIFLKKGQLFSRHYINRLIFHEIGTHVLRAENGKRQPFKVFHYGLPHYLGTEEGLAVVNEERFGLLNPKVLKIYVARAIAVRMAQTKSFSEVYIYLLQYFNKKDAFTLTLRVKRGLGDTSQAGGCTKDYVYLDGYHRVKEYLSTGGSIRDLYYGKIDVSHARRLKDVPGLVPPEFLPKNQSFKSLLDF